MEQSLFEIWNILSGRLPSGERLTAKPVFSEITDRLYCAVDSDRRRHLLIRLNENEGGLNDTDSRGISTITRELVIADGDTLKQYIDIECRDDSGHQVFDLLIGEIADFLQKGGLPPSEVVPRVLEKWRRFWRKIPTRALSREEQIGLFAELRFLHEWLMPDFGAEAVELWRGPFGEIDFLENSFCVEVKATTSSAGHIYKINGLHQLEQPPTGILYLFGLLMSNRSRDGENLVSQVQDIRKELTEYSDISDQFEEGLLQVGYNDAHHDEYDKLHFEIREECLYEVKNDFPRLSKELIKIPPGIDRVEYTINLNGFTHLVVAKEPSGWNP